MKNMVIPVSSTNIEAYLGLENMFQHLLYARQFLPTALRAKPPLSVSTCDTPVRTKGSNAHRLFSILKTKQAPQQTNRIIVTAMLVNFVKYFNSLVL